MSQYKDTLNLPSTKFPMRANLAQREPNVLEHWAHIDLYRQLQQAHQNRPKFILHDGPPYANGDIHIGHAVNKILKDIINKSQLISGYTTPYVPGWDCHGLPIELQVEKKIGKAGQDVTYDTFRQKCRDYAESQIQKQKTSFQRLGIYGDWDHPYTTMASHYEAEVIRALALIVENGHLEGGYKPVYWCFLCQSALAEAEVEYHEKASPAIDVKFILQNPDILYNKLNINPQTHEVALPIWTTTPWTLPANRAVAVNPEANYSVLQINSDHCLIVAETLIESVMARYGMTDYQKLATFEGQILEHLTLQHPFLDQEVPIILGAHVTLETGTGAVHTAPAHGEEDFLVGKSYGLAVDNPVQPTGTFIQTIPYVGGQNVFEANDTIIELLHKSGHLLHHETIQHNYPCCWRHKSPLIFRATKQWFISMDKNGLRHQAIEAIGNIHWVPHWSRDRMLDMIKHRPDWCISRQRSWGTPLPLLIHRDTDETHPNTPELMRQVADQVAQQGLEAWYQLTVNDLLPDSEAQDYIKSQDTLDVWFDSGVSHTAVLTKRKALQWPADVYIEGTDQYRGWFQSSLLTSLAMYGQPPFKCIIAHGFTVDPHGHKMSKSLGNVIAPQEVIKTLGADVLRLWVASADYRGELRLSDEILKRTADMYRRIRNTARFLLANLHDFDPAKDQISHESMLALDQWALDRAAQCQENIQQAYRTYQFHHVAQTLHHFCAIDMGGFYLDIIKDRQYTLPAQSRPRRSTQTAMYHILEALVGWLAPILSFTAEEIWQHMPWQEAPSVFYKTWSNTLVPLPEDSMLSREDWDDIIKIRDEVNKLLEQARNSGEIGAALEAEVTLYCGGTHYSKLAKIEDELNYLLITSNAYLKSDEIHNNAQATALEDLWVTVTPSEHPKCARCWHRRPDIGKQKDHPQICSRCVGNITGQWENRQFI